MTTYYLNLFSVDTWKAFNTYGQRVSGFSKHQRTRASKIKPGSIMLCYIVGLSRWVGALRVDSESYEDASPIFSESDDKFVVRFRVTPLVSLSPENAIPTTAPEIWSQLSWTRDLKPGSIGWGANFQGSLRDIPETDGKFIYDRLTAQKDNPKPYQFDAKDQRLLRERPKIRTKTGGIQVEIPEDSTETQENSEVNEAPAVSIRESLKVQAALAKIGAMFKFDVWIPRTDYTQLASFIDQDTEKALLNTLPLAFDDAVVRTIENIDVLWLSKRTIVRAFEVEHTTAIYSGLLRMADLLALVPNLDLPLHIVAPLDRKTKVFKEINRPVFQLMEKRLSECCSFISYENVYEILKIPRLQYMNQSIIEEFEEFTDY